MSKNNLPFEVGQLAEARSNEPGYRGAWFRCKIKGITSQKHKGLFFSVEYYDYPDEKPRTMKLYQKSPTVNPKSKKSRTTLQIMVRPCFPPVYHESQLPDLSTVSDVAVVVIDSYRVGDLVDWYTDGCFWTAKITEILDEKKVRVQLPPPPAGEGLCYEAFTRDMRPSLIWSLEHGWSLPSALGSESCHHCARLITPTNKGIPNLTLSIETGLQDAAPDIGTSAKSDVMHIGGAESDSLHTGGGVKSDAVHTGGGVKSDAVHTGGGVKSDAVHTGGSSKKSLGDRNLLLNSTASDTLEAAVLDLEELVNRVYWLKSILDTGMTCSRPSWKFISD